MVRSTEIIPTIRTDHDAILLEIGKLENGQKSLEYWKLNCSLLADDAYVNSVTELLPVWAADSLCIAARSPKKKNRRGASVIYR